MGNILQQTSTKIFKLCPWGQYWPLPQGSLFFTQTKQRKNIKISETAAHGVQINIFQYTFAKIVQVMSMGSLFALPQGSLFSTQTFGGEVLTIFFSEIKEPRVQIGKQHCLVDLCQGCLDDKPRVQIGPISGWTFFFFEENFQKPSCQKPKVLSFRYVHVVYDLVSWSFIKIVHIMDLGSKVASILINVGIFKQNLLQNSKAQSVGIKHCLIVSARFVQIMALGSEVSPPCVSVI